MRCALGARTRVCVARSLREQLSPHNRRAVCFGMGFDERIEWRKMGCCLLVPVDIDINVAVETLVLAAGVETVLAAFFEAVLTAVVGLVDADILFSAEASWTAAVVFSDADVLVDVLLVTGRAGLLGWWWLLTFPSSALDRYLLLSLDLFGLLVVFVGRRKDAERDSASASVWGFLICRHRCRDVTASALPLIDGANARPSGGVNCGVL
jgi:hypothetical protein